MKKKLGAFLLALGLMVGAFGGALAASNSETIQALLSRDITVKYDGAVQTLRDVNGKEVYPIAYEGSTYLPVRAIAGLMGVAIKWDNDTRTVLIGETERMALTPETPNLFSGKWTTEASKLLVDGVQYPYGCVQTTNTTGRACGFTLGGQYTGLEFKVLNSGEKTANFELKYKNDEGVWITLESATLAPGELKQFDVKVDGLDNISLSMNGGLAHDLTATVVDIWVK